MSEPNNPEDAAQPGEQAPSVPWDDTAPAPDVDAPSPAMDAPTPTIEAPIWPAPDPTEQIPTGHDGHTQVFSTGAPEWGAPPPTTPIPTPWSRQAPRTRVSPNWRSSGT